MCGSSKSFFERATQDHVNLRSLINPADLVTASQGVFTSDTRARRLLDQFTINDFVYHTMGAVRATPHIEAAAEQHGWQTRTNIKVHTAVPSNLLEDSKEDLIPLVRFHGGGGMTGTPFTENWLVQRDYECMLKLKKRFICIEPEYPLMPESSGKDIRHVVRLCWSWLFLHLESALRSEGIHGNIDWSRLVLFAESFGAYLAVDSWLALQSIDTSPALQVRGLILVAPLTDIYARSPGVYCGVTISAERANKDCEAIMKTLQQMPFIVRRSSTQPPDGMYCAHVASVSHNWGRLWGEPSMLEMVRSAKVNPGVKTVVYITHGPSDQHVPYKSSVTLSEVLIERWPEMRVYHVEQEGEHHVNYKRALDDEYCHFIDSLISKAR